MFPSFHAVSSQPAAGAAERATLLPTGKVPPPLTLPPLAGLASTASVLIRARFAVHTVTPAAALNVHGLFVMLPFQLIKRQLFEGAAQTVTLVPARYRPPPVTLPPPAGLASTVTRLSGLKFAA